MDRVKPLFVVGPVGCGKTTYIKDLARAQSRELLHCPCRKDRTLREQRSRIHEWAMRAEPSLLWLEGTDDLTPEAQSFLRRILETYSTNVLFCLEARTMESIQEPILSRCNILRIQAPTTAEIKARVVAHHGYTEAAVEEAAVVTAALDPTGTITYRQLAQMLYVKTWYPALYDAAQAAQQASVQQASVQQASVQQASALDVIKTAQSPYTYIYDVESGKSLDSAQKDTIFRGLLNHGNPWALYAYKRACVSGE